MSVDLPEKCRVTQERLKTPFPILSDSQHEAMDAYGTRSPTYKGPGGIAINTPTLILIDKTGTVRWIHQAENYKIRAPVSAVLEEAKKLK